MMNFKQYFLLKIKILSYFSGERWGSWSFLAASRGSKFLGQLFIHKGHLEIEHLQVKGYLFSKVSVMFLKIYTRFYLEEFYIQENK